MDAGCIDRSCEMLHMPVYKENIILLLLFQLYRCPNCLLPSRNQYHKAIVNMFYCIIIPSRFLCDSKQTWIEQLSLAQRRHCCQQRSPYKVHDLILLHPTCSQSFGSSQFPHSTQNPAGSYATICLCGESIRIHPGSQRGGCTSRHPSRIHRVHHDFQSAHL